MLTQNNKTNNFISKAIKIHKNRYDYSKVNYINAKTKINIICKAHGEFEQTPSNHLSKYNCQKCAKNFKLDTLKFIEKAKEIHKDIYDYSKVNYINADTKIIIICKIHGEFTQQPDFHLNRKCGCPKCSNNVKLDLLEFIEKAKEIHKDIYDYSKVEYINNRIPIIIICKKHGEFTQIPFVHLLNHGCPSCINKTEFLFLKKIQEYYPTLKKQYKVKWCKNKICLPFDFVIEELKIIIEIDGPQHFIQVSNWTSPEIQKEKDKYKINCANENGFSVIRLLQIDILKDKFDWFEELKSSISKINNEQKIQNVFICKNNEYDHFII
jgi:very-short-patch-repair endonuclease/transposase-like protein